MTLGQRLADLRRSLGLTQEAIGAQGFVSAPGWIKIEADHRQASERLIEALCRFLVNGKHLSLGQGRGLQDELLTLKYLGSRSPYVRELARGHALRLPNGAGAVLLAPSDRPKPRRGRPARCAALAAR